MLSYFMGCIALVRCVLVLRCGLAGVVWYPDAGPGNKGENIYETKELKKEIKDRKTAK